MKRFVWLIVVVALGFGGYKFWRYWKAGFLSLPDLPEGATPISFDHGIRAIMLVPVDRLNRKYLSYAAEVPVWFKDAWSTCNAPTEDETAQIGDVGPGARIEAVCYIYADGDRILRGFVISVPRI